MIAGSNLLVVQQAMERYHNIIAIPSVVLYRNEQVNLQERFIIILAMENGSISIMSGSLLLIKWLCMLYLPAGLYITVTEFEMNRGP